ncbi:hypothetical protein FXN63_19775 [Pigmentiphaga aceris]|uniref:Uncharacterized protein n=1 Tax=Pigmentiphaga aceris TaxID=1940612 RepID=A0A5C0B0C5_9BURK|nr:hypothetical protein [Pigmentiphaga aceris]QEI07825.1 hypothetical protein FXN63_19775 [Pigmentiphaga aceris]
MQRQTILAGLQISIPNSLQGGGQPFNVLMTSVQLMTDAAGQQIGYPIQQQMPAIAADLTPDVLSAFNEQLLYLGVSLVPIIPEQESFDA